MKDRVLSVKKALNFYLGKRKKPVLLLTIKKKNYERWLIEENYMSLFNKLNTMYQDIQITLSCRQIQM